MGYYTNIIPMGAFRKKGLPQPEDESISDEIIEQINGMLDCTCSMKISVDDDEIAGLSKQYPDFIIEVEGRGGDQEDLWRRRYVNGECEVIYPQWPDYGDDFTSDEEKAFDLANETNQLMQDAGEKRCIRCVDGRLYIDSDPNENPYSDLAETTEEEVRKIRDRLARA